MTLCHPERHIMLQVPNYARLGGICIKNRKTNKTPCLMGWPKGSKLDRWRPAPIPLTCCYSSSFLRFCDPILPSVLARVSHRSLYFRFVFSVSSLRQGDPASQVCVVRELERKHSASWKLGADDHSPVFIDAHLAKGFCEVLKPRIGTCPTQFRYNCVAPNSRAPAVAKDKVGVERRDGGICKSKDSSQQKMQAIVIAQMGSRSYRGQHIGFADSLQP